ncbi:MAG: hypothetical protein HOE56_02815, partial [Candidatus Marinimicrobia bacterium]|nr:hypothetical protein [Candidatus Neomarinimicrobiota bacterium]
MKKALYLVFTFCVAMGQGRTPYKIQFAADEFDKYTSVGNLGMTITNYGILGNGWNRMEDGSIHPSCEYKQHTEIGREQIEHFSYAALWVGGIVNGQRRVSTAIVDGVFDSGDEGFELFAGSPITIRSSISSTTQDSMAKYYSPKAISHQDMICEFKDYGESPTDGGGIQGHIPLGLDIHLKAYAWNYSYADAFVILNYTFQNVSEDTIHDIYGGIWADASVANFNYTDIYTPGGGFSWSDNLNGYDESLDDAGFSRDIGYQYDANGDDGWAESYIGISALGSNIPGERLKTNYHQWAWTSTGNQTYPSYIMPVNDAERYETMNSSVQKGTGDDYTSEGYPASEDSWLFMISAGPIGSEHNADTTAWTLAPGDSCNLSFTVVCGLWGSGGEGNSSARRNNLIVNYDWAQKAFDGEDNNRNNQLDEGEDGNSNGVIDRYILPAPPPSPNMEVVVESGKVTIYWQEGAESFLDPISQEADFEGYRIYGARKTANDDLGEFSLLLEVDAEPYDGDSVNLVLAEEWDDINGNGQYDFGEQWDDVNGDSVWTDTYWDILYDYNNNCVYDPYSPDIGYNTGFDILRIKDEYGCYSEEEYPVGSGNFYQYKFENANIKDGWLNYYAVTAYDQGDPDANLESLESSIYSNRV